MIGAVLRIRYELLQQIEESPVFVSYRARDRVMNRDVCVRTLAPPLSGEHAFVERLREVSTKIAQVQHESLERVYELDEDEETPFLVSELVTEQSLGERLKKLVTFSVPVSVSTAIGALKGLDKLHEADIVHGDVSSRTVAVSPDGKVKLKLGGIWESYSASSLAGPLMLPLLAPYMAPEIAAGGMPTPASDVYSVGILLYEMLTGKTPFLGDTAMAIAVKHATAPAPSLRTLNPSAPAILDEIVKKAISKKPEERYQTAGEMMSDLRTLQDALRFGKQLTWPIQKRALEDAPVQPVAPNLNVVRPAAPVPKPKAFKPPPPATDDDDEREGDVPVWLMWIAYAVASALVVLGGAWVFFNLNKPKLIEVPKIIGRSANEASVILSDMGLKMQIRRRQPNEKFPEETIIDVSPAPGESVRERGTVSVIVSAGSKFIEVPDLRGRDVEDARSLLALKNLTLDDDIRYAQDKNIETGKVISQVPEARRKVERQSKIRVTVNGYTPDSDASSSAMDSVLSNYSLRIKMPPSDMDLLVRVDMTDINGTKTVYEQRHSPNEVFEVEASGYGDAATFRIFFDGEIVKQVTKNAEEG